MNTTEDYNPTDELFAWLAQCNPWRQRMAAADQDADRYEYEINNYNN